MGRQVGPIFITGRVGDLCFYKSGSDYRLRTKGGPSREQVLRSPGFARVRENFTEFGASSKSARMLRQAIRAYLPARDAGMHLRLTKLFNAITKLDIGAPRGQRTATAALQNSQARERLKGFDFNAAAPLSKVLLKHYSVTTRGVIVIPGLVPSTHVSAPKGTTVVTFSALMVSPCNDNVKPVAICYNTVTCMFNDTTCDVVLYPATAETLPGPSICLLQVSFQHNINGVVRDTDPSSNSLAVVSVMKLRTTAIRKRAKVFIIRSGVGTFVPTSGLEFFLRSERIFRPMSRQP